MDTSQTLASFFDVDRMKEAGSALHDAYVNADPFPHVVVDDFLPRELFDAVVEEFPSPDAIAWDVYTDRGNTRKLATANVELMGSVTRQLFGEFNLTPMMHYLEALTGIHGLLPDPHLVGGGLHLIEPGGFLNVHADFNVHDHLCLDRRINLLLYLNPGWQEEWGGHLELWDGTMQSCRRRIAPVANRCVIFSTTDTSFHGHPDPLACPAGVARRSLALYYYSNGRPDDEQSARHTTLYQTKGVAPPVRRERIPHLAHRLAPPLLVDAVRAVRVKRRSKSVRGALPPDR